MTNEVANLLRQANILNAKKNKRKLLVENDAEAEHSIAKRILAALKIKTIDLNGGNLKLQAAQNT